MPDCPIAGSAPSLDHAPSNRREPRRRVVLGQSTSSSVWSLLLVLLLPAAARADIAGTVVDGGGLPVAGAQVRIQAMPEGPMVVTGPTGTFLLPVADAGNTAVAVAVPYDPDASTTYLTQVDSIVNPSVGVTITLTALPTTPDPAYDPPAAANSCATCHSEIYDEWTGSVHSTATEDFWVRDLYSGDGSPGGGAGFVFLDTHDPGDTGTCATCHSPIADAFDPGNIFLDDAYASGDGAFLDGVSCLGCHQIHRVDGDPNGIHTLGNSEYFFADGPQPTERFVFGPLPDVDTGVMRASYAEFFTSSTLCGSCHQYQAPFGQTTLEEWQASDFAVAGPGFRSCQDCHMPERQGIGQICDIGNPADRPGSQRHSHEFVGSTPQTLTDNLSLDLEVFQEPGRVRVQASVENFGAGHDFPTGVSIRNAMVLIQAQVEGNELSQIGGSTIPEWASDDVPGTQPGDYGGLPGKGFAKVLEGRINGMGPPVTPVLFVDAETVIEKSSIPSGATDVTEVVFEVPPGATLGDNLRVEARLLYRRSFRALAVTKGWTVTPQGGDIEIEVASQVVDQSLVVNPIEIPVLGPNGLGILSLILMLAALIFLRRHS